MMLKMLYLPLGVHVPRILKVTYQEIESLVYMKGIIVGLLTI